jgi:hypothetical protein
MSQTAALTSLTALKYGIASFEVPAGSLPPAGTGHAQANPCGLHKFHIRVAHAGLVLARQRLGRNCLGGGHRGPEEMAYGCRGMGNTGAT